VEGGANAGAGTSTLAPLRREIRMDQPKHLEHLATDPNSGKDLIVAHHNSGTA